MKPKILVRRYFGGEFTWAVFYPQSQLLVWVGPVRAFTLAAIVQIALFAGQPFMQSERNDRVRRNAYLN